MSRDKNAGHGGVNRHYLTLNKTDRAASSFVKIQPGEGSGRDFTLDFRWIGLQSEVSLILIC